MSLSVFVPMSTGLWKPREGVGLWKPREGVEFPGAGVINSCELLHIDATDRIQVLSKSSVFS